ncbi:hypothetical protein CTI12_AA385690 [Artemisia annua]|uniref:FYVE-type domain-containing protein n=1 Tax=Artemisia annua TaxID=35608 RepID=A0A2U1MFS7_ARTAN|nr:hypothetical protein CTI12_AA385690 [Artemisia annua]
MESCKVLTFDDYGRPVELSKNGTIISDQSVSDDRQNELKFDDYGRHITNHGIDTNIDRQSVDDKSCRGPTLKFDDYGRPTAFYNIVSENKQRSSKDGDISKVMDVMGSGVQKFRVTLHSGIRSRKNMDVLCEIGLAGIRLLDPAKNEPIEFISFKTILRWEVLNSDMLCFWVNNSITNRGFQLKSNSYTTTKICDAVAAAHYQLMEMGEIPKEPSEKRKSLDERKKYVNEEKQHWVPDKESTKCKACSTCFGLFVRRHHCRNCGDIFCDKCTQGRTALSAEKHADEVRVCDQCMAEVTHWLSQVKEVSGFNRHETLAKILQDEMEKRKETAEFKSSVPNKQMKEVECPTCTVLLQVEVPSTGSKTIECSLCQNPLIVNAH